ncbi:MAG: molybdate ABC transporter substrate-binding protein [Planctomycetota bacterium]
MMAASLWQTIRVGLVLALMCAFASCGGRPAASSDVCFLVAASAIDAATDAAQRFEAQTGHHVVIVPGPTNALAQQIIEGARADVFLPANTAWADEVARRGMAADRCDLLHNDLVLIVPAGNPAAVSAPRDLLDARVHHLALAGDNVPAGIYAGQALRSLQLFDLLAARVVRGNDVRATLAWVARGEAEAGVVYATDARSMAGVSVVYTFAADSHDRIVYPLMRIRSESAAADEFYRYLQSDDAATAFRARGFRR